MTPVGSIERIMRFPVKSMAGEEISQAFFSYAGVQGDRVYAFVKGGKKGNFPWMTAREAAILLRYTPRFISAPSVEEQYPRMNVYEVEVATPTGEHLRVSDPILLDAIKRQTGHDVELRFSERGMQDARPVSIMGISTIHALEGELGMALDWRRFRANLYVQWASSDTFYEDSLVGRTLRVGAKCEVKVSKRDPRCVIVDLDPETGSRTPQVLRTIAQQHDNCLGVYAVVLREGIVERGDEVLVLA